MEPPGGRAATFKPTVTIADPPTTFAWLGRLGIPGLFDGRHRFDLEPGPNGGTLLRHRESFSGILVPFLRSSLDGATREGFEQMNQALKARAESTIDSTP
jgi:hypothetical protein